MSKAEWIDPARASIESLRGRSVAVLGFGAQGSAHAQNLRDSGLAVTVAQRPGSSRYEAARQAGFQPVEIAAAVRSCELLIFALPDEAAPSIFESQIAPVLRAGQTLGFIHGFAVHYGLLKAPAGVDVVLVAPKAQGRGVRSAFAAGGGVPALVAVHQDATGSALQTALGWAAGIGAHRACILQTTFQDETETDLFGEQAVLCGGLSALVKTAFQTLVDAGYPPELAYFECFHELKLLVDLLVESGLTATRERISNAARFGDVTRGPRVISDASRTAMSQILDEIRSGAFAQELMDESGTGYARLSRLVAADRTHPLEETGARVRAALRGERPT